MAAQIGLTASNLTTKISLISICNILFHIKRLHSGIKRYTPLIEITASYIDIPQIQSTS